MAEAKLVFSAEDQTKPAIESAKAGLRSFQTTATQVSGQTANALRMIPAQMTDIVVGLSSGQSPLTVLLQQGGQLKDMFGGVGAAVRAVVGYVADLVTPTNLAVLSFGAVAVAAIQGSKELEAYNRAITLSGNASGTTAGQLQMMSQRISGIVGTTGKAAEVLAVMVASGKIDNADLERYATLAVRLDRVGVAAKETVADLAALGKDPLQASLRLNDSMNYLEVSTLRQLKALTDLGKNNEAAELAQQAYATAQEARNAQLESKLGILEKAWRAISDAAGDAWDAMKGAGRAPQVEEQLAIVARQITERQQLNASLGIASGAQTQQLKNQLNDLQRAAEIAQRNASASKDKADAEKAAEGFLQMQDATLSNHEKLLRDITKARELGVKAGMDQAAVDKLVANISYEESKRGIEAQIQRLQTATQIIDLRTKAAIAEIEAQQKIGGITDRAAISLTADADVSAMEKRRDVLLQEIALKSKERDSEREVAALRGQIDIADEQITERRKKRDQDLAVYDNQRSIEALQLAQSLREQQQAEIAVAAAAADARFMAAVTQARDYTRSVQDANEQIDFEVTLIGKSADEIARANEQRRIEIQLRDQSRRIQDQVNDGTLASERAQYLTKQYQDAASKALEKVDTKIYTEKYKRANEDVGESLYLAVTGRGKDAADRLQQDFEDLVLRPTIKAVLQPVTNAITSMIVGSPGQAGGIMGSLGGLGNLGSLVGMGSSIGSFGSGFSAGLSGLFGEAGIGGTLSAGTTALAAGNIAGGLGTLAGAALPWVGVGLLAASLLSSKRGGPKTESGYGYDVPLRGDSSSAKAIADAIQQQYTGLVTGLGGTAGNLQLGIFSAADPQGTAMTQLAVNAALNGQSIYSRQARLGGIENVGRSDADMQAAVTEETERVVLEALQGSGLVGAVGDYLKQLGDVNTLSGGSLDTAMTHIQQAQSLQATYFDLTATDEEKLAKQRGQELAGLDDTNKALAQRIYALQDEATAQASAAAAIDRASQSAKSAADFITNLHTSIGGYVDKLNGTAAGLLSPETQLANARSSFEAQLVLAQGGDKNALQGITGYADTLISAQSGYTASGTDTAATIAYVKQALTGLPGMQDPTEYLAGTIKDVGDKIWDGLWGSSGLLATKFDTLDANFDGLLSFDELKTALGPLATDDTIRSFMARYDTNGDGQISKLEAIKAAVDVNTSTTIAAAQAQIAAVVSTAPGPSSATPGTPTQIFGNGFQFDVASYVPSYDVGTPYVPYDQIAKVHKGEAVLTTDEAAQWRSGGATAALREEIRGLRDQVAQLTGVVQAYAQRDLANGAQVAENTAASMRAAKLAAAEAKV